MKPTIPKGWRWVRVGSIIQEGDCFIPAVRVAPAKSSFVGLKVIPGSPIIRRIAKKKAGGKRK